MLAYHNDPEIKAMLLAQLEDDFAHGRIVQGHYWNGTCGCLIGCSTRDRSHGLYEDQYDIPFALAHLFDRIFEGLPLTEAQQFTLDVHRAIAVGADLSQVIPQFLVWLLVDREYGVHRFADAQGKAVIEQVAALYQQPPEQVTAAQWRAAARAATIAYDAANARASRAAGTAFYVARAADDYVAAFATESAATFAAYTYANDAAAFSAETDAGRQAHYRRMRDKLLALLASASHSVSREEKGAE